MNTRALLCSVFLFAVPPAQASNFEFASEANVLCRAIIDARDYASFKAAQDRSLDLTIAQLRDKTPPTTADAETLSRLLQAVNTDLAAAIERLKSLTPSPELDAFLAYGRSSIHVNVSRIGFLDDLDRWQWPPVHSLETGRYDYIASMADLGFTDRDCAYVFDSLGNPPERAGFISVAASACNVAYNRLVQTNLNQWREHNLSAFAAALQGKPQNPDAVPALRELAAAWKAVADDFRLVDAQGKDMRLWEEAITTIDDYARLYENRANALEGGDEEAMEQAFGERASQPDFVGQGLHESSCIGLVGLM